MRFVRKSRALALCLLFPLTAAGCSGAPSPSSSAAAPTASAVSSAWSSAQMTTTAVTSAVTTSGKASTTQASPASARKTTTSRHAASATKAALATTGKQSTDSGFLNAALFNKGRDAYGGKSINILGDSISHGANAPNIPDHSYVGLLKKAVAKSSVSIIMALPPCCVPSIIPTARIRSCTPSIWRQANGGMAAEKAPPGIWGLSCTVRCPARPK